MHVAHVSLAIQKKVWEIARVITAVYKLVAVRAVKEQCKISIHLRRLYGCSFEKIYKTIVTRSSGSVMKNIKKLFTICKISSWHGTITYCAWL